MKAEEFDKIFDDNEARHIGVSRQVIIKKMYLIRSF